MDTVLRISLPGFDVKKARPHECAVDSDYNSPKIDVRKGHFKTIEITFNREPGSTYPANGTTTTEIYRFAHTFKYRPQVWAHVNYSAQFGAVRATFGPAPVFLGANTVNDTVELHVTADTQNVYVSVKKIYDEILALGVAPYALLGQTITVRLYVFVEEGVN